MIAIDPQTVIEYIAKCDRSLPPEQQTVFLYAPMSARDAAEMQDHSVETEYRKGREGSVMRVMSGTQVMNALKKGLKGWRNFKDADGHEVEWRHNNGVPRAENFDYIPHAIRQELAEVIIQGRDVSESDAKN